MKTTILSATAVLLLSTGLTLADMTGRADDGRAVILYDNGTWAFAPAAGGGASTALPDNFTITTGPGWKVTGLDQAALGWKQPGFDDSGWQLVAAQWANAPVPPSDIIGMDDTNAQWIWQKNDVDDVAFRYVFDLSVQPSEAWLRITADNAYWLYVNDTYIGEDTANDVGTWQGAEGYSIAAFLMPGRNVIAIRAKDYGQASGLLADISLKGTGQAQAGSTVGNNIPKPGTSQGAQPNGANIQYGPVVVGLEDVDVYQYSYRNWDNANWAKWTSLTLGSRISGLADTNRRIYFRFDPTPLGVAVKSGARVLLQLNSAETSTGAGEVQLYRVTTPWQAGAGTYHSGQVEPNAAPGVINWNNQPAIDFSAPVTSLPIQPGAHVYTFDITDLVRGWLGRQYPNDGLVLVGKDEGSAAYYLVFDSSESPHMDARPHILVVPTSGSGASGTMPTATNLIVNGSFEDVPASYGSGASAAGWMNAHELVGWTITRDNVDIVASYWQQVDGSYSLDMAGTPGSGAIAQDVATLPGARYEVSFMIAGNPVCEAPLKQMRVSAGGQSRDLTFDASSHTLRDMGWVKVSWSFTANAPTTRLQFESLGPNAGCGMALDRVEMHKQ